eukprot:TRINITY_DN5067_c1_g1_i1.p1 TRINITY_DN5067_c1_g1~~TRINITY_DN5067_c1_g1_i1.p1  ORF type:complete len:1156 (+),score=190.30 TRINITY_DN5067_c1_g1_i1:44-3511(+)
MNVHSVMCEGMTPYVSLHRLCFTSLLWISAFSERVMDEGHNLIPDVQNGEAGALDAAFPSLEQRPKPSGHLTSMRLVDKAAGDTREYQHATLPNGLQVVNVRDATATQAAFSVAVDAGSLDNPEQLPGLAHFCEHMLFLGTKNFPDPSGFDKFVAASGGSNNAYTADERTVYYTEVSVSASDEARSRFADFFRSPLFNNQYVSKEAHAIDSEHEKNVQDQDRRVFEILNSLSDPKSPVSRFKTGNIETLMTIPDKQNLDPVVELKSWFKRHYCPSRMRLATFGPESLEKQLESANAAFGNISVGSSECQKQRKSWEYPRPWPPTHLGKFIAIQGVLPQLFIHFPLPNIQSYFKSSPLNYVKYVMTYGGEHSLSRVLKDTLGVSTSFGLTGSQGSYGIDLLVVVSLTASGRSHVEQVLDVIFMYLAKLASTGVDKSLYTSLATLSKLDWDWSSNDSPSSTVSSLAESMFTYPPDDLLSGGMRIDDINTSLVDSLLRKMRPDNMNVLVVDSAANSTLFTGHKIETLQYYDAHFIVTEITEQFPGANDRWLSWLAGKSASHGFVDALTKVKSDFSSFVEPVVPRAIQDLPKDLDTKHMQADPGNKNTLSGLLFGQVPLQLSGVDMATPRESQGVSDQFWYREGWVTKSPKVFLTVDLTIPRGSDSWEVSPLDSLKLRLYGNLLGEEMDPKMYDLSTTGVNYDFSFSSHTITFSFSGFPPMMPTLMDKVLSEFDKGVNVTDSSRHDRFVSKLTQDLGTFSDMPVTYAVEDRTLLILPGMNSRKEKLAALEHLTAASVSSAVADILLPKKMFASALSMGNMNEESAKDGFKKILDRAKKWPGATASVGKDEQLRRVTPVVKPSKPVELRRLNKRKDDQNDVLIMSFLVGVSTVENRVILGILSSIVHNVAYTELRTNMQLGYVVDAGVSSISNVQVMSTAVQGDKLKADEVEGAVQYVFMDLMPKMLENMTVEELAKHKASLEEELLQPPTSIGEEVQHFWRSILDGGECLKAKDEMIWFLKSGHVSKETLMKQYKDIVMPSEGTRTKILVKHFSNHVPNRPTTSEARAIWKKMKVPDEAIPLLEREHNAAIVLDDATSKERLALLKDGSYFPTDLHCTRAEKAELSEVATSVDEHPSSLVQRTARWPKKRAEDRQRIRF